MVKAEPMHVPEGDAPEIDGKVLLRDVPNTTKAGDILSVKIEDADDYDLFGVPVK